MSFPPRAAKSPSPIGMPDMIGSMPKKPTAPPAASPMGVEPDGDEGGGRLDPMTVGYHEEPRNCGNCDHNQNGQCNVIGQQVSPDGGCMVWEGEQSSGEEAPDSDDMDDMGAGGPPMPSGGAPAMRGGYGG